MGRGKRRRVASVALVVLVGGLAVAASVYAGSVVATPISSDPYTNPSSQHRTQLEPDSFGYGNTVVATFQTGRFYNGGSSNIGWATTTNAGRTWTTGMLPSTTIFATPAGPWARISDPAVAYDPQDNVWMISTLAIDDSVSGAAVLTSRSTDGGLTWQDPVTTSLSSGSFYDKNWITCDTWQQSPYYGNCYQEWDDSRLTMSTSTDGGLTWGAPKFAGGSGIGGQPVVQPDGTVVVPYEGGAGIRAFRSEDGGNTWLVLGRGRDQSASTASPATCARRRSPRPRWPGTARSTSPGRTAASAPGVRRTTSSTARRWTAWRGRPRPGFPSIRPTAASITSSPASRSTARRRAARTHLALGYYYYPVAACSTSKCQLTVGFISSTDGGATWTQARKVAGPISLTWIASTNQGVMVGDYMSTSFAGGNFAFPIFAVAKAKTGAVFDERMYSARFDVTLPSSGPLVPRAQGSDPLSRSTTSCPISSSHRSPSRTPELINIGGVGERARRARSVWTAVAVAALGVLVRRDRLRRQRAPDADQRRPVHGCGELAPAQDAGRARLVRVRADDRRADAVRPVVQRRRLEQPRLLVVAERRTHVDDRRPARNHHQLRRPVAAHQ